MTRVEELKADLVMELEDSGESGLGQAEAELDAFAAAVIQDASVGTCHIGIGYNLTLDKPSTPDGDYYLIPKMRA